MKKKRIVYNGCHGGFSLSKLAAMWLAERGLDEAIIWLAESEVDPDRSGWEGSFYPSTLARHADLLVECVSELGSRAGGSFSDLRIVEVDDLYRIEEYDGLESVIEPHELHWISAVKDAQVKDSPY